MTLKKFFRELPLDGAIDALEDRVSPILVKELRLILRDKLFVTTHLLLVAAMGIYAFGACLWALGGDAQASDVGRSFFETIQIMQFAAVALVLPGVTATLISSERESGTFDMLLGASYSPHRILWGKLLSALAVTSLLVFSAFPLSLAAPILGGVELGLVLRSYVTLGMVSLTMALLSLLMSAGAKTAARAVVGSYVGAVGVLAAIRLIGMSLEQFGVLPYACQTFGFFREDRVSNASARDLVLGLVLPLGIWSLGTALLYAGTLTLITPAHPRKFLLLKLLVLAALPAIVALAFAVGEETGGPSSDMHVYAAQGLAVLLACVAAFALGSGRELAYAIGCAVVSCFVYALLFAVESRRAWELAAALAGWGFFSSALAFALKGVMPTAQGARILFGCLVGVLLVLPVLLQEVVSLTVSHRDLNPLALAGPILYADLAGRYDLDWAWYFPAGATALGLILALSAWRRREIPASD